MAELQAVLANLRIVFFIVLMVLVVAIFRDKDQTRKVIYFTLIALSVFLLLAAH